MRWYDPLSRKSTGKVWVSIDPGLDKKISSHGRKLNRKLSPSVEGSWNLLESCKISKGKLRVSITDAVVNKYLSSINYVSGTFLDTGETPVDKTHKISAHQKLHSSGTDR